MDRFELSWGVCVLPPGINDPSSRYKQLGVLFRVPFGYP